MKRLIMAVCIAAFLSGVLAYVLFTTPSGLTLGYALAQRMLPGELVVAELEGSMAGPLRLAGLRYVEGEQSVQLAELALDWSPLRLLGGTLYLEQLYVSGLDLQLPAAAEPARPPERLGLRLPLAVQITDLAMNDVRLRSGDSDIRLDQARLSLQGEHHVLDIGALAIRYPRGAVRAQGQLGLGEHADTALALDWSSQDDALKALSGHARLSGDWHRLTLDYRLQQPAAASLELTLDEPFRALSWQAALHLPTGPLQRFSTNLPAQVLGLELTASGDLAHARINGTLSAAEAADPLHGLAFSARLEGRLEDGTPGWQLRDGLVETATGGRISAQGQGPTGAPMQLALQWTDIDVPGVDVAGMQAATDAATPRALRLPEGRAQLSGSPAAFQFDAHTQFDAGPGLRGQITLGGEGNRERITLAQLEAHLLDGRINGNGTLRLQPALGWQLTLAASQLNPAALAPDWPGAVDARVELGGRAQGEGFAHVVNLAELSGSLRERPIRAQGRIEHRDGSTFIQALQLHSGKAHAELDGRIGAQWQLGWRLDTPDLAALWPGAGGSLRGDGSLRGTPASPSIKANIKGTDLHMQGYRLATLDARVDLDSQAGGLWDAELSADKLTLNNTPMLNQARIKLDGRVEAHTLTVTTQGDVVSLDLVARGAWRAQRWQGELQRADWRTLELGKWTLSPTPTTLLLSREQVQLAMSCWRQQGASLCASLDRADGWQGRATLKDLPAAIANKWLLEDQQLSGSLSGQGAFQWTGEAGTLPTAEARLTLSPGRLRLGEEDDQAIAYQGGSLRLTLGPRDGQAQLDLGFSGEDHLRGQWQLGALNTPQPTLNGELSGRLSQAALLESFIPQVKDLSGHVETRLQFSGLLYQPRLEGQVAISEAAFTLPATGVRMRAVQLALRSGAAQSLDISGSARAGEAGRLDVTGQLRWNDTHPWELQLSGRGKDFLVADLPEAKILIDPDLTVQAWPKEVRLGGSVAIPYARLRPRDYSGAVTVSADTVMPAGSNGEQTSPWAIYSDVQVTLGEDVNFKGYGLQGFVYGSLAVHDEPGRLTSGRGALSIRDGRYKAYGQDLTIVNGRAIFNDSPLASPLLEGRAVRRTGDVTAGIRFDGPLQEPQLTLYSDPTMAESDMLSYLLLGRPLNQASSSESSALMQAAAAAGLSGGEFLATRIGERLGFDEVGLENGETLEDAALSVGKYLSPRLYLSYSIGLLEPISTLRLRYQINKRWSLQTESGLVSGADIVFSHER